MATVKLTKNELKKEKDALKRYQRYLPTLQLKKQQLQMVLRQIEQQVKALNSEKTLLVEQASHWIAVFGEDFDLASVLSIGKIQTTLGNIAGIEIPVFEALTFNENHYDLFETPVWLDAALEFLKHILLLDARIKILDRQYLLVARELRVTSQRVNLFEKVKIPESKENIRKIQIYLGDQQTAAVVRGKIAKNNLFKESAS